MTTDEYINMLSNKIASINVGKAVYKASTDVHTQYLDRIFVKGLNSNNTQIGEYNSKNQLYINDNNSPKTLSKKGKTGKDTFSSGKKHKTTYFESYRDFRDTIGRESSFVNLNLFGLLLSDMTKLRVVSDGVEVAITNIESINKYKGAKNKYGNVFELTKQEKELYTELLTKELTKDLK